MKKPLDKYYQVVYGNFGMLEIVGISDYYIWVVLS